MPIVVEDRLDPAFLVDLCTVYVGAVIGVVDQMPETQETVWGAKKDQHQPSGDVVDTFGGVKYPMDAFMGQCPVRKVDQGQRQYEPSKSGIDPNEVG